MFPTQMLELLLDELSHELKNPELVKIITNDDLEWIFELYSHIRHSEVKALMAIHIIAKVILIERCLIKSSS